MNGQKPRNYYSLNLTEGRVFIIFISFIILLIIIVFGFVILLSNTKKSADLNLKEEKNVYEDLKKSDYVFYSDLTGQPDIKIDVQDGSKSGDLIASPDVANKIENYDLDLKSGNESGKIVKESLPLNDNVLVQLDDSEVLYSSNNRTVIKENNASVKKDGQEFKQSSKINAAPKSDPKRYVIQVGSYISKSTADDVYSYYQKLGYPVFIKENETDGKIYYRLRIGPFKEKDRAGRYLEGIKDSKFGKSSYISVIYL